MTTCCPSCSAAAVGVDEAPVFAECGAAGIAGGFSRALLLIAAAPAAGAVPLAHRVHLSRAGRVFRFNRAAVRS